MSIFHSSTLLFQETNSFDAAGRLARVSDGTNTATYSYLANSPLVQQIIYANSGAMKMTATKTYDNLNRLTGIVNGNGTIPAVDSRNYAYNSANQRTNVTEVDGSHWGYAYDSLGQMTNAVKKWSDGTYVAGQQFGYLFDNIGNRTETLSGGDSSHAGMRSANYAVNALNQITSRDVPGSVEVTGLMIPGDTVSVNGTYAYTKYNYFWEEVATNNDSMHGAQWLGINVTGASQTVSGYQFLAQTPETNYTYDLDGNLTRDGRWNYTWDAENRLVNMTSLSGGPAGSLTELIFAYDYKGRRMQKAVSTNYISSVYTNFSTNNFAYDGWNPVATLNTNSALISSMMWGLDLSGSMQGAGGVGGLLAENIVSNGVHFMANDGNGNVVALVSASNGSATANYEYGPFGELIRATGPAAKLNPIRFSSKYDDDESDFLYYGYRYYNPSTGHWLSKDPIGERGGRNLYGFIRNSPVNQLDAVGLEGVNPVDVESILAWAFAQTANYLFVDRTITTNVTCPSGSSKYLLYKYEKTVEERSHLEISIAGIDIPILSTVLSKATTHYIIEVYGCCGGCGFFNKNTTPWVKQSSVSEDTSDLWSPEFGPVRGEIGMSTRTSTETKTRRCINSVTPTSTWVDDEIAPYTGGF